jgi:hypothetical protein
MQESAVLEDIFKLTDLPKTVTSCDQDTSTPHKIAWLIQHDAPIVEDDMTKPSLVRSYSNYGCRIDQFDPIWEHEKQILKSLFKHWDVSRLQISQALQQFHHQKPSFCKILQYLLGTTQANITAIFTHRQTIVNWLEQTPRPNDECIPDLKSIFELVCKFFEQ